MCQVVSFVRLTNVIMLENLVNARATLPGDTGCCGGAQF